MSDTELTEAPELELEGDGRYRRARGLQRGPGHSGGRRRRRRRAGRRGRRRDAWGPAASEPTGSRLHRTLRRLCPEDVQRPDGQCDDRRRAPDPHGQDQRARACGVSERDHPQASACDPDGRRRQGCARRPQADQGPLKQHQLDALVSFTFNCGEGALASSTLRKRLNRGEYAAVPQELNKWVMSGGRRLEGLVRRRKAEGALFHNGKYN